MATVNFSSDFQGLFFSDKAIQCPYCQIKFATILQLKNHKENYCTPQSNFELLDSMFHSLSSDTAKNGPNAMMNEKNLILIKGLYFLKNEWEIYNNYLENPNANILADQQAKKSTEDNSRKPHFEALFSDYNPDAENLKKYPVLEGYIEKNFNENLKHFGIVGETTDLDADLRNIPNWLKGTDVNFDEKQQNIQGNNYIDNLSKEDLNKIKAINLSTGKGVFENKEYLKLFNAMRNDLNLDMQISDIKYYLQNPAKEWEADFFDTQRKPTRQEIDDILEELDNQGPRKSKYTTTMSDLFTVYESMSANILSEVDLRRRDKVAKLAAQRELLFRRETIYLSQLEQLKKLYFMKLDKEYFGLDPHPDVKKSFMNLLLRLKYQKILFEGEHNKIIKDLASLRVENFLERKNQSSLMLTASNALNPKLTSRTVDPYHPYLNRARHLTSTEPENRKMMRYLNLVRDIEDVRQYYGEMGGLDENFNEKAEHLQSTIIDQHGEQLRERIPNILNDPK